jgi:hypothetical protein
MVEVATGQDALTDQETGREAGIAMIGIIEDMLPVPPHHQKDEITPTEGQEMILADPGARSLGQNVRDVISEGRARSRPAIRSTPTKKP